jgi:hypothetical protein
VSTSGPRRAADEYQRNALAPGLLGAAVLIAAPVAMGGWWFSIVQYAVAILALIVAWFAVQARQWWWLFVFIPIAVLWNPVLPLPFSGPVWIAAQLPAAAAFVTAGLLIKAKRVKAGG